MEAEWRVTVERLDRCVANKESTWVFPMAKVLHFDLWGSNHRPFLLATDGMIPQIVRRLRRGARRFFFEEAWSEDK